MHQLLIEPDEEKFFGAIKAYVVTRVVSCRVSKEGSSKRRRRRARRPPPRRRRRACLATSFADTWQISFRYATIHWSLPVQDSGVRQASALDVAVREALHGLHQVLERVPVLVRAAAALVVRERGERDDEDLVGAARGPRTLDEARRALRKWSYL